MNMDIEILLNFNYEHLKNYLLNSSVDERKKVSKIIKEKYLWE